MKRTLLIFIFYLFASTCFAQYAGFEGLKELSKERTYNQKVFDIGNNQKRYRIHVRHIHYKKNDKFEDIDTTLGLSFMGGWEHDKASYHCKIPEYADGWFEFYNAYENTNHTIKAKPVCNHVKGVIIPDQHDGYGHESVLYEDAFGKGIDFRVVAYWAGLRKLIIIKEKPLDTSKDLIFDFELQLLTGKEKVKDREGNVWNKTSKLNFKDKTLKIGDDGKESYFRNARVWDSGQLREINQPVDIELYKQGNKIFLRKTIKAEILQKAIYPLYTDHPTSYYVGAGDGWLEETHSSSWDTCHDSTTASETVNYTSTTARFHSANYGDIYIARAFLPINTSGIDDSSTVTAATLYIRGTLKDNDDNDGNDFLAVVQTTQASSTALIAGDFDQCGAINNPTEGASRIDFSLLSASAYNAIPLNATGIGWIKKTAGDPYTMLGLREGHDVLDDPVASNRENGLTFRTSEYTSIGSDPYLDVTVSGAARRMFIVS